MVNKVNHQQQHNVKKADSHKAKSGFKQKTSGKMAKFTKKHADKQKRRQDKSENHKAENKLKKKQQESDDEMQDEDIDGSDFDQEMAQIQEDLDADKNLDETIFDKFQTGELDLPSDPEEASDDDEDIQADDDDSADDLDEYYRELGIDPEEMKPASSKKKSSAPTGEYVVREKKETNEQVKQRQRSELLNQMMNKARTQTNYKILSRIIQVVKSVFTDKTDKETGGADDLKKDKSGKPVVEAKKKSGAVQVFSQALNSEEYLKLLQFFSGELPTLCLKLAGVEKFGKKVNLEKVYVNVSAKMQILLKSYSANFTRLLGDALNEQSLTHIEHFFLNGVDVVRCILPHKTYAKKLGNICARITVNYSRIEKSAIILAFNALKHLNMWLANKTFFETIMKKMYNEFTRESKIGGGGIQVQERLRICQNCFIELLSYDRSLGYQLGFQYIRQLCLHLRNIRNKLTPESVKSIYSWQFYNCMKLWVLALTTASQSDLVLLVHPLVNLIAGVMRLSNNIKYFPYHLKCFEMLTTINEKTGQFVPAAHYMLHIFDSQNYNFFNAKPKKLEDKLIPDSVICLKVAKKHLETSEMKDRIIRETISALTNYYACNAQSICFPEMLVSASVNLRKFKKSCKTSTYRQSVQTFLDLLQKNVDKVSEERAKLRDKSLREPAKLIQQFTMQLQTQNLALVKESEKLKQRKMEQLAQKLKS